MPTKSCAQRPPDRNILFVPDQNLGAWVMERTGRKMDLWQGTCYVHVEFTARSINRIREQYPDAPVVAHPECTYAVRMLADEVCSTEKMIAFCKESPAREIIIVTEAGMLHRLQKEIPDKTFIPGPTENCFCGECRFMKMNTLEKAHAALLNMEPEIILPEPLRKRAEAPIPAHARAEQIALLFFVIPSVVAGPPQRLTRGGGPTSSLGGQGQAPPRGTGDRAGPPRHDARGVRGPALPLF